MNLTTKNCNVWYQICLALLVSVSLIGCGGESSSNSDNNSDEIITRTVTSPNGNIVEVDIDPNSGQRTARLPDSGNGTTNLTLTVTCSSESQTLDGVEVCDVE